jgi:hypothetical protein
MLQLLYLVLHPLYDRLHVIERGAAPAATAAAGAGVVLGRSAREGVTQGLDVPLQPVDVRLLLPYLVFLLVDLALQGVNFVLKLLTVHLNGLKSQRFLT